MPTYSRLAPLVAALALPACLNPYGGATETDPSAGSSTDVTTSSTTAEPTTDETTTTTTTGPDTTSTTSEPVCGDGFVDPDEDCDNGPDNADDAPCTAACKNNVCGDGLVLVGAEDCDEGPSNSDAGACTSQCKTATCGDGLLQDGVEACDDGVNDGSYGGCAVDCSAASPKCGDGNVDTEFEECDGDLACMAESCVYANSCLDYKSADPISPTNAYLIRRDGVADPLQVWCEMSDDVDGGGYTFLKVDVDSDANDFPYQAKKAEMTCAAFGMKLLIPRSDAHLRAAYTVATTETVAPVGGGTVSLGSDYLRILGIYPETPGVSCVDKAINHVDCPEWVAGDTQAYWVSAAPIGVGEPDPDGTCAQCSMSYTWNPDGTVKKYVAVPDVGGSSFRFMCDTGDKLP